MVLTQDGAYRIYSLSVGSAPPSYTQHSLGSEAQEAGVLEAKIYEEGMVALLGSLNFVEVKAWQREGSAGGKVTVLANAGLEEKPSCWCVISPDLSSTRGVEVLIGSGTTILRLDEIDVQDQVGSIARFARSSLTPNASQRIARGPFLSITPSPNGRFLSLLSASPTGPELWVTSSDFARSLSEFDLSNEGETGAPQQVVWCGDNTVVAAWERTVVMVGPFGETLK